MDERERYLDELESQGRCLLDRNTGSIEWFDKLREIEELKGGE
jgi:hypothetical protein